MDVMSWWRGLTHEGNRERLEAASAAEDRAEELEAYRVMPLRRPWRAERELLSRGDQWRAASEGSGSPANARRGGGGGLGKGERP